MRHIYKTFKSTTVTFRRYERRKLFISVTSSPKLIQRLLNVQVVNKWVNCSNNLWGKTIHNTISNPSFYIYSFIQRPRTLWIYKHYFCYVLLFVVVISSIEGDDYIDTFCLIYITIYVIYTHISHRNLSSQFLTNCFTLISNSMHLDLDDSV